MGWAERANPVSRAKKAKTIAPRVRKKKPLTIFDKIRREAHVARMGGRL